MRLPAGRWWLPVVVVLMIAAGTGAVLVLRPDHGGASQPTGSTDQNALIGVTWRLTSFLFHGKPGVPDIVSSGGQLSFPDRGTINFRADCNYSGGSVTLSGGTFRLGEHIATTAIGCGPGQAIPAMTEVLGARAPRWAINGSELTVRKDAQNALVFRRQSAGQFPSDYPGSPATGLEQLVLSGTPVRLLYGPSAALGKLWLGVEVRRDNDAYNRYGSAVSGTLGTSGSVCDPVQAGQEFFFFGAVPSDATSATLRDPASGQQVSLKLYRLGSSGFVAYAGRGSQRQAWTLTVRNAAGQVMGAPCSQPKAS